MADNVTIPATGSGTATPVIATDDVGGVQYQRVKLDVGADGATTPVTAADPLPVVQTGTPGLPTGAATETTLAALNVLEGAVTETAPATDTASSGLNGRLQRIAQRLTSLIALLPAALGAGGGVKVDGSGTALPVSGTVTATVGTVTAVTSITNVVHVDDNAGSLTVDGTVAATQSGTWTVQPGNTANTTAWKVDGSAVTQPVSLPAIVRISQTPTVSTSPAYTAKDTVGGLLTFANAVRVSGGSGILQSVTVIDLGITPSSLELMLFDRTFTASTDNAIYDPTDGDLANALPSVAINSWQIYSDNSLASVSGLAIPIVLNGTSLFGQLRTLGTPTFAGTTDITVMIEVIQN